MASIHLRIENNWIRTIIPIILILLLGLAGCRPKSVSVPAATAAWTQTGASGSSPYQVYFSQPDQPEARSLRGGPDAALASAIDQARLSVDVAALDLNLWSLRDALIAAQRRGARVRMVVDSDYLETAEVQDLMAAGIPVLGDRRESLMHHKFVVIDREEVWTGSMNFTLNGAYRNDNNLLQVRSPEIAADYEREFEEMFVEDRFGDASRTDTPYPQVDLQGIPVEVRFSPDDGVVDRLVELVDGAGESVYVLAYAFTSDPLTQALLAAAERGVAVSGVFDAGQARANQGSDYQRLVQAGLDIRLDGSRGNMHHKVLILDEQIVVLGSYNFSASAELRNDENTLIISDPALAKIYLQEFERIYAQAEP
jgi:phosphatidylserine/phosphatidylglycerophosphate/cardiolipin synthase-like enzyme